MIRAFGFILILSTAVFCEPINENREIAPIDRNEESESFLPLRSMTRRGAELIDSHTAALMRHYGDSGRHLIGNEFRRQANLYESHNPNGQREFPIADFGGHGYGYGYGGYGPHSYKRSLMNEVEYGIRTRRNWPDYSQMMKFPANFPQQQQQQFNFVPQGGQNRQFMPDFQAGFPVGPNSRLQPNAQQNFFTGYPNFGDRSNMMPQFTMPDKNNFPASSYAFADPKLYIPENYQKPFGGFNYPGFQQWPQQAPTAFNPSALGGNKASFPESMNSWMGAIPKEVPISHLNPIAYY